jgi:hypothetical protein
MRKKNVFRKPRIGQRFGRLTVTDSAVRAIKGHRCVICRCECGTKNFTVRIERLYSGGAKTCGCSRAKTGHAAENSPTYASYRHMVQRVAHHKSYQHVRITPRWLGKHGFENVLEDLGPRPAGTSLGRILDGDLYSRETASWQTSKIQGLHRRGKSGLKRFSAVYGHRRVKVSS